MTAQCSNNLLSSFSAISPVWMLIMFNQNVSLQHFRGVEARSIGMFVNKNNPRQRILSNLLRSVLMQLQTWNGFGIPAVINNTCIKWINIWGKKTVSCLFPHVCYSCDEQLKMEKAWCDILYGSLSTSWKVCSGRDSYRKLKDKWWGCKGGSIKSSDVARAAWQRRVPWTQRKGRFYRGSTERTCLQLTWMFGPSHLLLFGNKLMR